MNTTEMANGIVEKVSTIMWKSYNEGKKDTIKKAVEWLAENAKYYANNSVEGRTVDMDEDFLTDFRKAMEK